MAKKITELAALSAPAGSDILPAVDISDATGDANGTTKRITLDQIVSFSGVAAKLDASAYTASDVLAKLKTLDGAGSGLDADFLDGFNSATGATANTIALRNGSGDLSMRYAFTSYVNMSHAAATRNTDTVFYSSTDAYIRKNNAAGFRTSLNVPTRTGGDASGTWGISISGNAATATALATARTISLGGDLSGSASFDGSANITITATVADDSHAHVIANVDGLQTALDSKLNSSSYTAADVRAKVEAATDSNVFTDADHSKLNGIAAGAEVNAVDSVAGKTGAVTLVKGDVGLGSVDNTSDAAKPVSTAQQTALDAKQDNSAQAIQTSAFTAVAGRIYPCDTSSAAFTATLPASPSQGDRVTFSDAKASFGTNNLTIARNGQPIAGSATDLTADVVSEITLEYIDGARGWNVFAKQGAS